MNKFKNGDWVVIFRTTYHYWRHWIKEILIAGKVSKARFMKDKNGYKGNIAVLKEEAINAKKALSDYKKSNPDVVDMWK